MTHNDSAMEREVERWSVSGCTAREVGNRGNSQVALGSGTGPALHRPLVSRLCSGIHPSRRQEWQSVPATLRETNACLAGVSTPRSACCWFRVEANQTTHYKV